MKENINEKQDAYEDPVDPYPLPLTIELPDLYLYLYIAILISHLVLILTGLLPVKLHNLDSIDLGITFLIIILILLYYLKFVFKRKLEFKEDGIYETLYFRKKTKFIPWNNIKRIEANTFEFSFVAKIKLVLKEYDDFNNFSIPLYAINWNHNINRLADTINQAIKKS